ncbi:MAG: hypothetical protein ACXV5T_09610 [Halobacteriota archaeon]
MRAPEVMLLVHDQQMDALAVAGDWLDRITTNPCCSGKLQAEDVVIVEIGLSLLRRTEMRRQRKGLD